MNVMSHHYVYNIFKVYKLWLAEYFTNVIIVVGYFTMLVCHLREGEV